VACSAPSAEDLVAGVIATRNNFEVNLSSWIDRDADTPQPWLYLDVAVLKNTEDNLTRLTVLVKQLDVDGTVIAEQRVAIDVSDMDMRGLSKNYGLEVRPMAAGVEGVTLVLEPNPPPDVWDQFPELDRVRPRGQ
jgi:hypothetical protein